MQPEEKKLFTFTDLTNITNLEEKQEAILNDAIELRKAIIIDYITEKGLPKGSEQLAALNGVIDSISNQIQKGRNIDAKKSLASSQKEIASNMAAVAKSLITAKSTRPKHNKQDLELPPELKQTQVKSGEIEEWEMIDAKALNS